MFTFLIIETDNWKRDRCYKTPGKNIGNAREASHWAAGHRYETAILYVHGSLFTIICSRHCK